MDMKIRTPADCPDDDIIGQLFVGHDWLEESTPAVAWFCDSYDPMRGYWMTRCDKPEHRKNVSEQAISRSIHKIRFRHDGKPFSPWLKDPIITKEMLPAPYFVWPPTATMKRETGFITEIGRFADTKWVARNEKGVYIDMDKYRNDLRERLELRFYVVVEGE